MVIPFRSYLVGAVAVLIGFNSFNAQPTLNDEELEVLFRDRTNSDWQNVWHSEAHSRCRDKLLRHLYWACEKDIYHLTRRNKKRTDETFHKHRKYHSSRSIWLVADSAQVLLRTRRTNSSSITNECCSKHGCTWEEYAEYCPSNKRQNHY